MSDTESSNGREDGPIPDGGILAALPRSRPQRMSPRRAAARDATSASKTTATEAPRASKKSAPAKRPSAAKKPVAEPGQAKKTVAKTIAKPAQTKKPAPIRKPIPEPPVPRQGYEPEEEFELGVTVDPPNGVELVESVADIVGELANTGLAAGGRLLRDAFSLLRRP